MPDLLTTDEAASYLRLSERKLYELVATGSVPCTKVTGRWLFPKAALDRWVAAGLSMPSLALSAPPPILGGSHDPLLDWALRESKCGLASLPEGSEAGLMRLVRGEIAMASIHLHRISPDSAAANVETVLSTPGLHDAVLIAFAKREQGLLVAHGNPLRLSNLTSAAKGRARVAQRPRGAGAQLLLLSFLAENSLSPDEIVPVKEVCPTGHDLAQMIRSGRADCGIAPRAAAAEAGLDFVSLAWEHFDLVLRQRDYFSTGPQKLFGFMRTAAFQERALEMGGYDVSESGQVRLVN